MPAAAQAGVDIGCGGLNHNHTLGSTICVECRPHTCTSHLLQCDKCRLDFAQSTRRPPYKQRNQIKTAAIQTASHTKTHAPELFEGGSNTCTCCLSEKLPQLKANSERPKSCLHKHSKPRSDFCCIRVEKSLQSAPTDVLLYYIVKTY